MQMSNLGAYLREQGGRSREAGQFDCCTFPADWCIASGLPDPMAHWRASYDTEDEALVFIREAGGLVKLFDCGMSSAGISRRVGEPVAGDLGVIRIGEHEAGAIFTGRRWAFVAKRGVGFASIDPDFIVAVWAVCHG